jgi:hypothetical protein
MQRDILLITTSFSIYYNLTKHLENYWHEIYDSNKGLWFSTGSTDQKELLNQRWLFF